MSLIKEVLPADLRQRPPARRGGRSSRRVRSAASRGMPSRSNRSERRDPVLRASPAPARDDSARAGPARGARAQLGQRGRRCSAAPIAWTSQRSRLGGTALRDARSTPRDHGSECSGARRHDRRRVGQLLDAGLEARPRGRRPRRRAADSARPLITRDADHRRQAREAEQARILLQLLARLVEARPATDLAEHRRESSSPPCPVTAPLVKRRLRAGGVCQRRARLEQRGVPGGRTAK